VGDTVGDSEGDTVGDTAVGETHLRLPPRRAHRLYVARRLLRQRSNQPGAESLHRLQARHFHALHDLHAPPVLLLLLPPPRLAELRHLVHDVVHQLGAHHRVAHRLHDNLLHHRDRRLLPPAHATRHPNPPSASARPNNAPTRHSTGSRQPALFTDPHIDSGGRSLTRLFRDARRFPSPGSQPALRSTRTSRRFGIRTSFKDPFPVAALCHT
jgi:hypothetical protein